MNFQSLNLDLLEHPICLADVEWLAPSHWAEHVPFAMWIVSVLRPRVLVELGTFRGTSYCGFCQAIKHLGLPTRAHAVDCWKGDPHNGANGPEVLDALREYHDPRYAAFSRLHEMTFDEAAPSFRDGEIDLLHIDGYHTYEAVRHDFETWQPKLSERGVVLFHDIVERIQDFGVYRFWDEIKARYPSFEFHHEHGLGVAAVGRELPEIFQRLIRSTPDQAELVRRFFHQTGRRIRYQMERDELAADQADRIALESQQCRREDCRSQLLEVQEAVARESARRYRVEARLHEAVSRASQLSNLLDAERLARSELEARNEALRHQVGRQEQERTALERSMTWRLSQKIVKVGHSMAPAHSARRRGLKGLVRSAEIVHREGYAALAQRFRDKVVQLPERRSSDSSSNLRTWKDDGRPIFLLVHHRGGGGIERHVGELTTSLQESGVRVVHLAPGGPDRLVWSDVDPSAQGRWTHRSDARADSIAEVLDVVRPAHAHIHSLMGLPSCLVPTLVGRGVDYDWTLHDYYPICPRAHLNRADGRYCGEPWHSECDNCLAMLGDYQGNAIGEPVEEWRLRHGGLLRGARRIFAPSDDARRRIERHLGALPILVKPHPERTRTSRHAPTVLGEDERVRVLVPGTITVFKGSELLHSCAEDSARNERPVEFIVLGRTDRNAALRRTGRVRIVGAYREHEAIEKINTLRCHLAFLPSLVPETYMYTLSLVLSAGFYPVCLDLGAQAERIRTSGVGLVLPADSTPAEINLNLIRAADELVASTSGPALEGALPQAWPSDLLGEYYGFTDEDRLRLGLPPKRAALNVPHSHFPRGNSHARVH
jgi:glycosyltransferase involved in cell wall biosynthesis